MGHGTLRCGEGAPKYYEGTDVKSDSRNECRRAPSAYPVLLAEGLYGSSSELDFYACSGAKIRDLISIGDAVAQDCGDRGAFFGQHQCSPAGVYGRELQVDNLLIDASTRKDTSDTELVLVSIGGNDVGFGQIVQGCLLPGSCVERREIWFDNVKAIGHDLETLYTRIKDEFGAQVPIVVMPYPLVLAENSCSGSPLNSDEHAFIVEFTTLLNLQLQVSASRAGVHFFEEGMFTFEAKRACETSSEFRAVNLIALQATDGDFLDRINPKSWPHNSMHPNPEGHSLTYERLSDWLVKQNLATGVGANPEPAEQASLELLGAGSRRLFAVDTEALLGGSTTDRLLGLGCDPQDLDGFISRLRVLDAPESGRTPRGDRFDSEVDDVSTLWWPVSISGADRGEPICFTDRDGQWQSARVGDHSTNEMYGSNGELFLRGRPPHQSGGRSETPKLQWVLFMNQSGAWELRAVQYCSTDSNCEASFDDWSAAQLARTYRSALPPLAIVFFGGWMFALGWNIGIWPRIIVYITELSQAESSKP